jgi:galactose mutarotase-like enzyme
MKISNETLAKVAEIKAENSGRVFFNVGAHMLSYFFMNGQHIVANTYKFWKTGVVDSVGGRMIFSSESEVLNYIKEKSTFLKSNVI